MVRREFGFTEGATFPPPVLLSDVGGIVVQDHWGVVARELATPYFPDPDAARRILYELCPPLDLGEETLHQFHRKFTQRMNVEIPWEEFETVVIDRSLRLVPQTFDLYRALRQKLRIRIVAVSNIAEFLWSKLEQKFRISEAFDASVLSSRCHHLKPDPQFYAVALRTAGCGPEECILLDDSERNVQGARAAGIRAFHVSGDPQELRRRLETIYPEISAET